MSYSDNGYNLYGIQVTWKLMNDLQEPEHQVFQIHHVR